MRATFVKVVVKRAVMTMVLEARMEPSEVAKIAVIERMRVIRSRCHSGQLRGSLGSSDGWGT